jgi:coatomer subunit beta
VCLRAEGLIDAIALKKMTVDSLLIMCAVVKMAEITVSAQRSLLAHCQDRITLCCRALLDPKAKELLKATFIEDGKATFAAFLKSLKEKEGNAIKKDEEEVPTTQADDLIHFHQLRKHGR